MKLCKDCRWFEPRRIHSVLWTEDKCHHDQAVLATRTNYATGRSRKLYSPINHMRGYDSLCGHDARYFEPKGKK